MFGLLQNGPFANSQVDLGDAAPAIVTREALDPTDEWLEPIPPGHEFPAARFVKHLYRLVGFDRVPSPIALTGFHQLALYTYVGIAPD
jgi:hypothetical protein